MELWIRSQDKEVLTRVVDIWKDADKNEIWSKSSFATKNCLGIYKTKERALEVLDEIQRIIYPKEYIEFISDIKNESKTEVIKNHYISYLSSYVYEMPEK
jgi:hypothetical protein